MRTAASQPQEALFNTFVERLNDTNGVVTTPYETGHPDRRITLARMAGELGQFIAPPRPDSDSDVDDKPLEVHADDFKRGSIDSIDRGLYMPEGDPRADAAEQLIVISNELCLLEASGVVPASTGVVFPAEEFHIVARDPRDFARHIQAQTRRKSHEGEKREDKKARVKRSAGHGLEYKLNALGILDEKLIEERKPLTRIYRDCKPSRERQMYARYKSKNLDRDRRAADEMIHNTAETASINFNLGETAVNAMHRAITSNLYRRGSAKEIDAMWLVYTRLAGRYINARRGKIDQSRNGCERRLELYAPALEAARAEAS